MQVGHFFNDWWIISQIADYFSESLNLIVYARARAHVRVCVCVCVCVRERQKDRDRDRDRTQSYAEPLDKVYIASPVGFEGLNYGRSEMNYSKLCQLYNFKFIWEILPGINPAPIPPSLNLQFDVGKKCW